MQAPVRRARRRPSQTATMSRLCHPARAWSRSSAAPVLLPKQTFLVGDGRSRVWTRARRGPRAVPNRPYRLRYHVAAGEAANRVVVPHNRVRAAPRTDHCHHLVLTGASVLPPRDREGVWTKASGLFLEPVCETSGGAVFVAIPFRAFPLSVEASVHPEGRAELRILPRVAGHPAPDHTIAKMVLLCGAPGVQAAP